MCGGTYYGKRFKSDQFKKKLIRRCRIGAHDGEIFVSKWTSEPFPA